MGKRPRKGSSEVPLATQLAALRSGTPRRGRSTTPSRGSDDGSEDGSNNIVVSIRIRPLMEHEHHVRMVSCCGLFALQLRVRGRGHMMSDPHVF